MPKLPFSFFSKPEPLEPRYIEDKRVGGKVLRSKLQALKDGITPWAPWIDNTPGAGSEQYAAANALGLAGPPPPDDSFEAIEGEFGIVSVTGSGGGMVIEIGATGDRYLVQSEFSYPGKSIQYNQLVTQGWTIGEAGKWAPTLSRDGETIVLNAFGSTYSLQRRIRVNGRRVEIHDTITNTTADVIGLAVAHKIMAPGTPESVRVNGLDPRIPATPVPSAGQFPDNPTVFAGTKKSGLGLVAEDNAFRLESAGSSADNTVTLGTRMLGIAAKTSYTMRWALYLVGGDHFDFINALRHDWDVNFTVDGPWDFFSVESLYTAESKAAAKKNLERKQIKLYALNPWFEYYSYWGLTRDIYAERMRAGMEFIRETVPDAKFLACIETNLTPVPLSFFKGTIPCWWPIGRQNGGKYGQSATFCMTQVLKCSPWRDSLLYDKCGRAILDAYYVQYYVDPNALNLMVYATTNNYWQEQVHEKIKFVLDTVGFDGIYFDQFSYTQSYLAVGGIDRYTYNLWDGHTVTLDKKGNVDRKFADCALLSADARRTWIDMVLDRGKIPVCNTNPSVEQLQHVPTRRFMETPGYEPLEGVAPYSWRCAKGQLGSPLALGYPFFSMTMPSAETWNRVVIAGLRFGLLSYYYWTDFPEDGPLGGAYDPMHHLFPFTPVELHEGWVLGKERLVTCVSGEFFWPNNDPPQIVQFDRVGRKRDVTAEAVKTERGYRINIRLDDWWEIAVVT